MTFNLADEFDNVLELAVRRVQTPEGAKKFGQPIGTIITADMLKAAKNKDYGKAEKKDSSKGKGSKSIETLGTKFDPQTGKMKPGSKAKKLSPEENYSSSVKVNGVTVKESNLSGPNSFKVGDSTFSAPAGSKLIRPKGKDNAAYVLTPDGKVHAFSVSGEVEIPEELDEILKKKFSELKGDDPLYTVEEFDQSKATSLKDSTPGAKLSIDGEPAFTKIDATTWQHDALGIVLTDDDLQPQFDAGKFELTSAEVGDTDFSKLTKDEITAILDDFEVGKKLSLIVGGSPSLISKNRNNSWSNSNVEGATGVSSETLAHMVEGTNWLSDRVVNEDENDKQGTESSEGNGGGQDGVSDVPGAGGGDSGSGGSDGPGDSDDEESESVGEVHGGIQIEPELLEELIDYIDDSKKVSGIIAYRKAMADKNGGELPTIKEAKDVLDSIEEKYAFHIDGARVRTNGKFTENDRTASIKAAGGSTPPVYKLEKSPENAKLFREQMLKSLEGNEFRASVYVYDESEYREMDLFLADDGLSGIAIHNGDEIVSVFSTKKSKHEKVSRHLISVAVENGGKRLDAFDTVLPKIYAAEGFKVKSRLKWNDEYSPEGWDKETFSKFNNGEPDVVFMAYDPENLDSVYTPGEGKYVNDYEKGLLSTTDAGDEADEGSLPEGEADTEEESSALDDSFEPVIPENAVIVDSLESPAQGDKIWVNGEQGINELTFNEDENEWESPEGYAFSEADLQYDLEDGSVYQIPKETPLDDEEIDDLTSSLDPEFSTPSDEDDASSGLSDADKQSAIEALESHSGFQVKYGLKSLPDTHPLKDDDTLKTEQEAAKEAYPDLKPKQALLAYLKGEKPAEPLADWEKELLYDGQTVQIGSENPKKVVQGVTGGVFTQKDIQDAVDILENYPGKQFKNALVQKGNALGALSPNDIIGFEKDKLVGKQKYIDFLKGKLEKFKTNDVPEEPKKFSPETFDLKNATLGDIDHIPEGAVVYFNGNDVKQTFTKTAPDTWELKLNDDSYEFHDKDMLDSFNNDEGWSFNGQEGSPQEESNSDLTADEQAQEAPEPEISEDSDETLENGHALISDPDNAVKVGGQTGSNPGGLYNLATSDGAFKKFYVKKAQTEDHGKNEALANALYKELGVNAPNVDFASDGNIYSEIVEGKHDMNYQMKSMFGGPWMDKIRKDFAIDAWLSNRDVFGMTYDNILTDADGNPWKIDNGGALKYRAMGEKKNDFGTEVTELDAFKTGKKSVIFGAGAMSEEQELDGVNRLAKLSPERIDELVAESGMDSEMADILKSRREYILNRYKIDDPFSEKLTPEVGVPGTLVNANDIEGMPEGTRVGFQSSPDLEKPNFYLVKTSEGWRDEASGTIDFPEANMKEYANKGYLSYAESNLVEVTPSSEPSVASPNGIAPGKYNTGKGAKAHLYVNNDGTGVYKGMKGIVKELDAEGVKKNYDAGMNIFQGNFDESEVSSTGSVPTEKSKVIPTLGTVDTLSDGTYEGPFGVVYSVKGEEVESSKPVKAMDFSSVKVGQIPDSHFKENAPVGTKMSFELYKGNGSKQYVTKNADGDWKGDEVAENYLGHIDSPWAWKHKNWKVESFPVTDDKKVTKASLKSKYLQGQLLDPETKSSVFPPGYSGAVTFFDGPADISSLSNLKNVLKDTDVPVGEKLHAHTENGVNMNVGLFKAHLEKKYNSGEPYSDSELLQKAMATEIENYISTAKLPEAQDFSKVFLKDEHGAVAKPLEIVSLPKLSSYYDSTSDWTAQIKKISSSIGDGNLIGANMAGALKDDKVAWVSAFHAGDFAKMYKLELETAQKKGKTHPTGILHPGHPDNTETHKITWGAAVAGEIPAGQEIPGNWTSIGIDAPPAELDNYLILAKMQNPTQLTTSQKRNWVRMHREGHKESVDQLSAQAALRAKEGLEPLSPPPVWTDNVIPAKSYDSMFDDTQFPQTWNSWGNKQKAWEFYNDNVLNGPESQDAIDIQNHYNNFQVEDPYLQANVWAAKALDAFFAKKEEEYLEELNKPVWEVKKTVSEGSHPTFIVKDQKSEKMKIFKPTTPGKEWRADNEVAAHNLGAMLGFNVPGATIGDVNEGIPMGTNNTGIVMDFAPNVGSLGNVDGASVDLTTLTPTQFGQLAKEHVFDWFLDNDDTHDENMLIGTDGNLVAIDKGRAFVQYGHWHGLDVDNPDYLNVNTKDSPSGRKNVVYADMITAIKNGSISQEQLDEAYKQALKAAKRVQKSDDNTIAAYVRSASDNRESWELPSYAKNWNFLTPHPESQDELVEAVLARKNSMVDDFEEFYEKLYAASGFSKPEPPAKALGDEHLSGWEESDVLTKTEEAKVWGAAPIHGSAAFADGASLLWTEKDTNGNSVISGKIKLGNITQQKVMDFMASKISPHSGVQATSSLKDYPTAHVKQWKKTVTAVGKDLSNNATTGAYNDSLWDEMKTVEGKVDTDLAHAETVDVSDGGQANFPSGVSMPTETVPMYVMALNYHKGLIANVEKAKAAQETTDKAHFQDFQPPSWKTKGNKYISPEGWTYKELDDGNYVEVKNGVASVVPDAPDAAKSGAPGWTVEKSDTGADSSTEKYTLISAGMFAGELSDNGEKILKSDFNTSGHPGKEYRIDLPTGEKIFFRDGSQTSTVTSQTGTIRFQLNRLIDSEASLANVQSYLETTGLDMSGADEEQVENVYWRQMFSRIIGSNPQGAPESVRKVRDKLLSMKSQLSIETGKSVNNMDIPEAIGLTKKDERTFWYDLAVEAWGADAVNDFLAKGEHLPKYQHMDLNDPEKATGLPWYRRIDVPMDKLFAKGTMLAHGNNGKDKRHFDYIKSGAYTSTEERLRILGFYKTGASSSSDQGTGGASSVFTRVAKGGSLKKGSIYGSHVMYWSPEVMSMTGTYSFDSDQFGNLSYLETQNKLNPLDSLDYTSGGNETMIPNNVAIYDFMEIMVFESENERLKAIEEFKKKGIDQLRGLPIEDRLVVRTKLDAAMKKIKEAWKQ